MKTKRIKIKDIKIGNTIRSPLLPNGFIKRVENFKKILSEVEKTTMEETILNFQKDMHPENELEIWEHIASNYQNYINVNPNLNIQEKKEVFSVLLRLSMGMEQFEDVKILNKNQISSIKNAYINHD